MKKLFFYSFLFFLQFFIFFVLSEIFLRVFYKEELSLQKITCWDERNLFYQYDSSLGWFPVPDKKYIAEASQIFKIKNNELGFRDSSYRESSGRKIMFLGDSFTWGFDINEQDRFTDLLKQRLPDWQILNCGVSGYGTDQEYLLLKKYYDVFKPEIVFLTYTWTDREDNITNTRYGNYYKPYFEINKSDGTLVLKGCPVPKSQNYYFSDYYDFYKSYLFRLISRLYFRIVQDEKIYVPDPTQELILEINRFLKEKGCDLIIGFETQDNELMQVAFQNHIPYLLLENSHVFKENGRHWTEQGNRFVSEEIFKFLSEFLQKNSNI